MIGFGLDRLCGLTLTVFGPGFRVVRSGRHFVFDIAFPPFSAFCRPLSASAGEVGNGKDTIEQDKSELEGAKSNVFDFGDMFRTLPYASKSHASQSRSKEPAKMLDLPITLPSSLEVAVVRVPEKMTEMDFATLMNMMAAFKDSLVKPEDDEETEAADNDE